MILSQCSDLQTQKTKWVARRNDDSSFYEFTTDWGISAVSYAAQFADAYSCTVAACPISGHRYQ